MEDSDIITNVDGLPPLLNFPRPPKEYRILRAEDGRFTIDGEGDFFKLASQAYDFVHNVFGGNPVFDSAQLENKPGSRDGGMYFEDGTHRLLLSHSFEDKLDILRRVYKSFLAFTEEYRADPEDWVKAYHWLDIHPAFWSRRAPNDSDWRTEGGMTGRWESVHRNEDGSAGVMFEHGGTVFPEGTHHFHDTDLDVYSTGLEQAFVDYARKVDKHFNLDGTRKQVGYGYGAEDNKVAS